MAETLISHKVELSFTVDGKDTVRVNANDPLDSLTAETVSAAMEVMVGKHVLQDSKGNLVTSGKGARILRTTEQVLF